MQNISAEKTNPLYTLGIDVGSTTVKAVLLDLEGNVLYANYVRHGSKVKETSIAELKEIREKYGNINLKVSLTGSAGLGLSERADLPFVQEVESAFLAIKELYPEADCAIELGGEDAKIIFITGGVEERMNGQCAGGTGAFIDQMATLLNISLPEMDEMALRAEKAYPIASRCGVFAKSDIQAILNQGASKEDISLSIFYAVADQTIAGLAQGREIKGNVLFLGGPLFFLKGLRKAFKDRLKLTDEHAYFPEDASTFMAKGAAIYSRHRSETLTLDEVLEKLNAANTLGQIIVGERLFEDEKDFEAFLKRHQDFDVKKRDLATYEGKAYLGIDEGSTTTKVILLSENNEILYSHYEPNNGLPIEKIVDQIKTIYKTGSKKLEIVGSAVTGYGEELIKNSLHVDYGLVETVAHFKAAKFFEPNVDFIIDIGGQDIKCFRIKNGAIDSIMLNEACSSGCGSFLSSFAAALGYGMEEFSKLGLYAKNPVELGSRCTVFMNSSVKEAQRNGATIEDISAGLSRSVIKNALYKVIRVRSFEELGERIVCQGGTFLNNAVLRCFEMEIGHEVIRPSIAGLMGAFGAALYAKEKGGERGLIDQKALEEFTYTTSHTNCRQCTSYCNLTILRFPNGGVYISGNKCEKGEGKPKARHDLDMYHYKRKRVLQRYSTETPVTRGKVGIPFTLAMYEQLPLWDSFFKELGFEVEVSPISTRTLYRRGQKTIPSDTACYPAKIMHGHIDYLLEQKVDFIFYPSESYNINEHRADNYYNCPVVAYYGELLKRNDARLDDNNFIDPFLDLNNFKKTVDSLLGALSKYGVKRKEIERALKIGQEEELRYRNDVKAKGKEIIETARKDGKEIVVLVGRPYHADREINHGIDKLLDGMGVAVLSEDSIEFNTPREKLQVLNQWTYHARLYDAANYVKNQPDMEIVHLVSFGCGVDAITSDEVRRIMESAGRLYTQIKIDEINNLGAVRIRLRSLLAAVEDAKARK
ncbi:MAG: 2-hydroxyacyl-CoA dehydratase [Bacilli bacterium]|nr:2-hydroxyacyl-CoA dehydratase [Bacilli bacterium]MBQ4254437.1 2-hydroxyacyl-CoA dehydratase [Bacilli bacterium]